MTLNQISKKHGISYSGAIRKMRNQKPIPGRKYGRKYSEESVLKAFRSDVEEEVVAGVGVRKVDCVRYMDCLTSAAILDLEMMDCGWCEKYEKEEY